MKTAKKKAIVIVGAGEFARIAAEYFSKDSEYRVAGFSAERKFIKAPSLDGLPVAAFEDIVRKFPPKTHDVFVAVTFTAINTARERLTLAAEKKGYTLARFVSSKSFVDSTARVGPGSFVYDLASVQPFSRVGKGVVIGSLCQIAHRAEIGDFAYLASSATVGGFCRVGSRGFLGLNSTLADRTAMAAGAALAAGAVLTRDASKPNVYRGNPAEDSGVRADALFR